MASRKAVATGVWSNAANWDGGTLPQVGDDVYSNSFNITIDQNVTVVSMNNGANAGIGAVAGGGFLCNSNRSITSNITATTVSGVATLAITGAAVITITGNLTGGTLGNTFAVTHGSSGTITVIGNLLGGGTGSGNGLAFYKTNANSGAVVIVGNLTGGPAAEALWLDNTSSIVTITGTVQAGVQHAIRAIGTETVTINGNCIGSPTGGGAGIFTSGIAVITVNGLAIGGESVNVGFTHAGVYNSNISADVRVNGSQCASTGVSGTYGFVKYRNTVSPTVKVYRAGGTSVTLTDPLDIANVVPVASDVRDGVLYLAGSRLGSLKVPSPSNVRKDIQTDNTVGTAQLTADDLLDAIQDSDLPVAERLRNCSTAEITGAQIAASQS